MKILIVNSNGLGDGVIEIPFLLAMEGYISDLSYYHTDSILFEDKTFINSMGLRLLTGTVPSAWRKFDSNEWDTISSFIKENNIDTIVNFRKLGPKYDQNYFLFKEWINNTKFKVNFWDFYTETAPNDYINIRENIKELLCCKNAIPSNFENINLSYLDKIASLSCQIKTIGINMNAGDVSKLWPQDKWNELCIRLVDNNFKIKIFLGISSDEQIRARNLTTLLCKYKENCAELISAQSIFETTKHISQLSLFISVDTGLLHIATLLGVKTIGLYITTSSIMWGGYIKYFFPIQSHHINNCSLYDINLGICKNKHKSCPLLELTGDGIDTIIVFNKALELISH